MPASHIYQISYSEQTRASCDKGFIALDNSHNERPDWREYWPIRNFLLTEHLNENDYYGFFSPKFTYKTGLDSVSVHEFIHQHADDADVVLFSPFFDQAAFTQNLFEQGAIHHHAIWDVFQQSVALIAPHIDCASLVMDSRNTVFCNYFVAKPKFWKVWLDKSEAIFSIAEAKNSHLAKLLNASTNHDAGSAPNKVFVIERIASLILTIEACWKVKFFNSIKLKFSPDPVSQFESELIVLDALKIAYATGKNSEYLALFKQLRREIKKYPLLRQSQLAASKIFSKPHNNHE